MTDAEIAGIMGWRGPGAYTEASLRKIHRIIEQVQTECRATPPSPSTAPTVKMISREAFERWYAQYGDPNGYVDPAWEALQQVFKPVSQESRIGSNAAGGRHE